MNRPELHASLAPLAAWVGTWRGGGGGHYPTIDDFAYVEEVTFGHVGKPFLTYQQKTRNADGLPMHAEVGYLRLLPDLRIEWVLAHPTGITEVTQGSLVDDTIEVVSTTIGWTATAKKVLALRRQYRLAGDVLTYDVWMSFGSNRDEHHLHADLQRV